MGSSYTALLDQTALEPAVPLVFFRASDHWCVLGLSEPLEGGDYRCCVYEGRTVGDVWTETL